MKIVQKFAGICLPLSVLVFIVFMLANCASTLKVNTNTNGTIDFSQYKTFDFYQVKEENDPLGELTWRRILMALELELGKKGIKKSNDPDLLINVYAMATQRQQTNVQNYGVGMYYGGYYGGAYMPYGYGAGFSYSPGYAYTTTYRDGTFVIDVIDHKKEELIMQSIVTSSAQVSSTDSERRINYAVKKIFNVIPDQK